ncbi:SWIM-type domain-containing protein [Nephila pilipes]|uniref:SWIM-type domain-containing protein n=1 Tax=Nephila pilipes TaxID=299642 RepID=A0A8X6QXY8_NEPPI|nr:SWIM-type domain-containing protein [Nephila pilipes]
MSYSKNIIFDDLPNHYNYFLLDKTENIFIFRIKEVKDEVSAWDWLRKLSEITKVTWRKAKTYPRCGRNNVFRVDLKCQHAKDHRTTGIGFTKKTNCEAILQIVVKRYYERTRSEKRNALDKEYPTIVTFKNTHNHSLDSASILRFRDLSSETKEKLRTLFYQGHSAASALCHLKSDLMLEYKENYFKIESDGFYVPSISVVSKLFQREFSGENVEFEESIIKNLKIMIDRYNNLTSGRAELGKSAHNNHFVVICTPIMMRAHKVIPQTAELVLVEVLQDLEKKCGTYFFTTPTPAGDIPIAAIVSDIGETDMFEEALTLLKKILPNNSFFSQQMPKVLLTREDMKERESLKKEFPLSQLFSCQFHFLKTVWIWLCDEQHNVTSDDREEIYFMVKDIMDATSEDDAVIKYLMLLFSPTVMRDEKLRIYCENLWEKRNEWASYVQRKMSLRISDSTNYVAVVFRVMKDLILNKLSSFNFPQKVNYILTRFEKYVQKWLVEFCKGKYPKSFFISTLPKISNLVAFDIVKIEGIYGLFKVLNNLSNEEYIVDIVNGICSCRDGQIGKLCTHALEVITNLDDEIQNCFDSVINETKHKLFYVATGTAQPNDLCSQLRYSLVSTKILNGSMIDELNSDYLDTFLNDTSVSNSCSKTNNSSEISDHELTSQDWIEFEALCNRIKKGIDTSPETFVPAVKKMLRNTKQFANTDVGLVSAIHNFATYQSAASKYKEKDSSVQKNSDRRSTIIKIRPSRLNKEMDDCTVSKTSLLGKRKATLSNNPTVVSIHVDKITNATMHIKI